MDRGDTVTPRYENSTERLGGMCERQRRRIQTRHLRVKTEKTTKEKEEMLGRWMAQLRGQKEKSQRDR